MTDKESSATKKSKIPYFFFVFFAVILLVNIIYIYLSQKTWRGLVTDDAYHKGLHYNDVIAGANEQKELGWKMKISYKNSKNKSGELEIFLQDKNNKKISDAVVTTFFKRPTQDGKDFSQEIRFINGRYFAKINFPLAGQWDFIINANKGEEAFQESKRYIIQ
ncbi:MAG: hypothetical protein EBS06_01565 [Proteobacteria bacterium]|nr:hypothetical protein [Pseudomonadota bacterium]